MSNLKVEGKVADFCPKCKNCKSTTRRYDGKKDWLTEVKCEDPYDGMIKTLDADSDICCSMFEPKPDRRCEKCERFDGTYCHGPNGTITISYKALFGEPVNCPSYEEKKDKEFNTLISDLYKQIQDLKSDNARLDRLYSERDGELKELIKASKRKDDLIQDYRAELRNYKEKYSELENNYNTVKAHDEALTKHFQNDEKLIDNIQKVVFPQEEGSDYTYGYEEILKKVKGLKDKYEKLDTHYQYDEAIIKDIQDIISPGDDSIWSYSEIVNEIKDLKLQSDMVGEKRKQFEELTRRYNMIAKKLNDIHDILKEDPNNE